MTSNLVEPREKENHDDRSEHWCHCQTVSGVRTLTAKTFTVKHKGLVRPKTSVLRARLVTTAGEPYCPLAV